MTLDPHIRVGDREREDAAARLADHHAAGRLDTDELERRLERAGKAVFGADLQAVEADLPGPPVRRPLPVAPVLLALAVALFVVAVVAVGHPVFPFPLLFAWVWFRRRAGAPSARW